MHAIVWVDNWQVQSSGQAFVLGQRVTWPISRQINKAALLEDVGPDIAARVEGAVDFEPWHPTQPDDTPRYNGIVEDIRLYRSRLAEGHVVPGTVRIRSVVDADGWESEDDGLISSGYLVTLSEFEYAAGASLRGVDYD